MIAATVGAAGSVESSDDEARPSGGLSAFLGTGNDPSEPYRPYSPDLASGSGRQAALSHCLGRADGARARAHHRHGVTARGPQRHRHARRLLRALPCAGGLLRHPQSRSVAPTLPTPSRPLPSARSSNGPAPARIVSLDPWGHMVAEAFQREIAEGIDIRPSIAVTRARLDLHEMRRLWQRAGLPATVRCVQPNGSVSVVKIAIDPVWYLPGIAERFGTTDTNLRRTLFEQTAGMFPELVTQARPAGVPAARRRHHGLSLRRCRQAR